MRTLGWAARRAALFVVVLAMLSAPLLSPASAMRRESLKLITAQGERSIDVEITETPEEKAQGLMFRAKLADTSGMLFFYERPQEITMWMRNTYIPCTASRPAPSRCRRPSSPRRALSSPASSSPAAPRSGWA
jgi:hypothetical protein